MTQFSNLLTDTNSIFQAVTMELNNHLEQHVVNELIEKIINECPSINDLLLQSFVQQQIIFHIYNKFTEIPVDTLIEQICKDFELVYPGYIMQIYYCKNTLMSAENFMQDNSINNYEKFNKDAQSFISCFNEFTDAFRFLPLLNNFFAQKILPKSTTVEKFLTDVFMMQSLNIPSS